MTVKGPGRNRFYKKISADIDSARWYDAGISTTFGDLFDGNTSTATIKGGIDYQSYISDISIPDSVSSNSSELVGMKIYTFPTDVSVTDNHILPKFKIWKSNAHIGDGNEGTLTVNKRDLTVINAFTHYSLPWLYEDFSAGATNVEVVAGIRQISTGTPYITLQDAIDYQNQSMSKGDIIAKYTDTLPGTDILVVYVTKEDNLGLPWVNLATLNNTSSGEKWWGMVWQGLKTGISATFTGTRWQPKKSTYSQWDINFPYLPESRIKFDFIDTELIAEVNEPADALYTVFDEINVKGDKEIFDEGGTIPQFRARASFSTEQTLSGQSMKVECKWGKAYIPGETLGETIDDQCGNGATNRQEVQLIMPIPFPHRIDSGGSTSRRTSDTFKVNGKKSNLDDGKAGYAGQVWSGNFYFDNMDYVFRAKSASDFHQTSGAQDYTGINDCAILRGAAITLSATRPLAKETFYDFMYRTTNTDYDEDTHGHGEEEHNASSGANDGEWDHTGTTSALIIARYPINGSAWTDVNVDKNVNIKKMGANPLLAIPMSNFGFLSSGDNMRDSGTGIQTSNLGNPTSGEIGDAACFHESRGPTVWYNTDNTSALSGKAGQAQMGAELSENHWYNIRILLQRGPGVADGIYTVQIFDSQSGEAVTSPFGMASMTGEGFNRSLTAPRYLTIWAFNYPGDAVYSTKPDDFSRGDTADFDTSVKFYIDSIYMHGMNHLHSNATVTDNNMTTKGKIDFSPMYCQTSDVMSAGLPDTISNTPRQSSNYLSIGFDTLAEFDQNDGGLSGPINLFFNNIELDSNADEIFNDGTNRNIRAGFTSTSKEEVIGGQQKYSFFEYASTPENAGPNDEDYRGLSTVAVNDRGFDFEGITQVDNFSKKGVAILDFNSQAVDYGNDYGGSQVAPAKRENFFASARVMDISGAEQGILVVDDISIFNLPDDTEYVIYKKPEDYSNEFNSDYTTYPTSTAGTIVKLTQRPTGNTVQFNTDCRFTYQGQVNRATYEDDYLLKTLSNTLCIPWHENILYVSPLKYWIVMEVFNISNTIGVAGAARSYESIAIVNSGSAPPAVVDYGVTSNEYTYTDAGTYLKAWELSPGMDSSVETQTDYGFEIMDEEENLNAGYINETLVDADADSFDKWLVFDVSSAVMTDKMEEGDILSTIIAPTNSANSSSVTIATSENTDKIVDQTYGESNTKRPFALAIYEDELPEVEDFEVMPNIDNPFYPEFTWKCADVDLWYGFIIIDTDIPVHQYHKSSMHIPMWRPLPSNENTFMNWPPSTNDSEPDVIDYHNNMSWQYGYKRTGPDDDSRRLSSHLRPSDSTTKGVHTKGSIEDYTTFLDPEGLSGWCHNFGEGDYLVAQGPLSKSVWGTDWELPTSVDSSNSSWIIHIKPSLYPNNKANILFSDNFANDSGINLWLEDDGKIACNFGWGEDNGGTGYVELRSHSIVPKNGIDSTCIIMTFDKDLTHGNCKLFINGKLEDLSGRSDSTGTATRWRTGQAMSIGDPSFGLYVFGMLSAGAEEPYFGRMEEFAYYPHTIYPVNPADGKFIWDKPVTDLDDNGEPISYFARLFVKDYHNIRGTTTKDVACSSSLNVHRVGVSL